MKFTIVTLGCKVNSYESEAILNDLLQHGLEYVDTINEEIEVCIVNTCTVTSTSDQKSRQMIRSVRRKAPNAIIVAMGCYVQLHKEEASEIADIVIGTDGRTKVYEYIQSYLNTKTEFHQVLNRVTDIFTVHQYEELKVNAVVTHTRGFVKIQDGCENYCSYCAIPYARGKIRSRKPQDVITEINELIKHGTKEVIISGINTGCYGKDFENMSLAKLIEQIMEETSLFRLRLSSIELMEVTDELLQVMKKYETRITNHLHIPLQGGSDTVLKRMHRKYLTNEYRALIHKIRTLFPNIAITTDFLAGFVGETEKEFEEACKFIQEMEFAMMHIFPYSRRKNTEADQMEGHLDPKVIRERAHQLLEIGEKMKNEYEKKFIGTIQMVIVERRKQNYFTSHTSNYLEVYLPYHKDLKENSILSVKIERIENGKIIGKEV